MNSGALPLRKDGKMCDFIDECSDFEAVCGQRVTSGFGEKPHCYMPLTTKPDSVAESPTAMTGSTEFRCMMFARTDAEKIADEIDRQAETYGPDNSTFFVRCVIEALMERHDGAKCHTCQ